MFSYAVVVMAWIYASWSVLGAGACGESYLAYNILMLPVLVLHQFAVLPLMPAQLT